MQGNPFNNSRLIQQLKIILFISLLASSCTIPKNFQKDKPYLTKNNIEVKGGKFTAAERAVLKQRLNAQLDDSSRVNIADKYFFWHIISSPPAYDSNSSARSAINMETSMLHLGYYKAKSSYWADTSRKPKIIFSFRRFPGYTIRTPRVTVNYTVDVNKPTLIDTVSYILRKPELQSLALQHMDKTFLKKGDPITKAAVIGEINRLVELYRNNGYYKFTSAELIVRGDTTVAALTTVTDDIFEQLRLLAEAQQARDSPTIKLAVVLNPPADSSKIKKYYINNIYILPDYRTGDDINDPSLTTILPGRRVLPGRKVCDTCPPSFIVKYHKKIFRTGFLGRNLYIKRGDVYSQENFYKTLNSFSKAGVWQSSNIQIIEVKDKDSINLIIQLMPGMRYGFEASIEASYSASSNTNSVTAANAGNLLGLSGNVSVLDRNLGKEAIRMTNALRAGVEFNFRPDSNNRKNIINSNEVSYSNSIVIPRFVFPFAVYNKDKHFISKTSFMNTKVAYINRINLFNLQSFNIAIGYDAVTRKNYNWVFKLLNIEFARLYNETDSFRRTLAENPFLRYSFNTSLVAGGSMQFSYSKVNEKHPSRQHSFKINAEVSGIPWGNLGILDKYMRHFVKTDVEYIYSTNRPKSAFVFRLFAGVGVASKKDTTLPFFKQYFGGGSNSMRGWPVRGIGRGAQPLADYGTNRFNDRTGDMQLESNIEYRYTIAQIIPNSLILRGALFMDIGNVWNLRNTSGGLDSTQFKFSTLYKQLGVAAGTGFRFDFNYFILRLDLGFRIKRPDVAKNDGWQVPGISYNNLFRRGEKLPDPIDPTQTYNDNRYRKWRYENFNFTIGISYPF